MGSGYKQFTATVLTAADVNDYLMEQSVMSFVSNGARDAAITAPEDGMVAYINSNDANEGLYTYNGTSWRKGPGWNAPWGFIANTTTQSNTVSSTYLTGLDTIFTAVANRRYKISIHLVCASNIGRGIINITDGATVLRRVADQTNPVFDHLQGSVITTLSAGSHTIRTSITLVSGAFGFTADSATNVHSLSIEDIGPSGAPA
jgi:hypothetical protein